MELREPPRPRPQGVADRLTRGLLVAVLAAVAVVIALLAGGREGERGRPPAARRELASRLLAAGALDEAAAQYDRYLDAAEVEPGARGAISYSVGVAYLEAGRPEEALRWLYEAQGSADPDLAGKVAPKLVHALERLGRTHAARAVLAASSELPEAGEPARHAETDPVVARIGDDEIRRSEVDRALDDLPPEMAAAAAEPAQRAALLERYVADELLWRKAKRLEYDRDPEVLRRQERVLRQLAVSRFVEKEVASRIEVDEADLRNHFEAHRDRFAKAGEEPDFEKLRPAIERDYRQRKLQSAYEELIAGELAAADVELFPERMRDGG